MRQHKKTLTTFDYIANRTKQNLLYIILFAFFFIFIARYGATIFYRYFDSRDHYIIKEVVATKDVVRQCESMEFHIVRHSDVLSDSVRTVSLLFTDPDGNVDKEYEIQQMGAIEPGDAVVSFVISIPCDMKPNVYRARIVTTYEIQGVKKFSQGESNTFLVSPRQ